MGVTLFALRMSEDFRKMQDIQLDIMKNKRVLTRLTSLSAAIGNGDINPAEIASLGNLLFIDGLEFMQNADAFAQEKAAENADTYANVFSEMTASEYYTNSSLMEQAKLYFDESGALDTDKIASSMYEEYLADYAQELLAPEVHEMETQIQNENDRLQTEYEQLSLEYDSLKQSKSQAIQRGAIQLS